jgi:hypothetical protein
MVLRDVRQVVLQNGICNMNIPGVGIMAADLNPGFDGIPGIREPG